MKSRRTALLAVTIALAIAPGVVWAQEAGGAPEAPAGAPIQDPPPDPASVRRPYRGLFDELPDLNATQQLILNGSVYGAYDTNRLAVLAHEQDIDPRLQDSGYYSGATARLTYRVNHQGHRAAIFGSSSAVANYYYSNQSRITPHYSGIVGVSVPLGRATVLSGSYALALNHYYRFVLFPDGVAEDDTGAEEGDPAYDLVNRVSLQHTGRITLTRQLSSRSSLSMGGTIRYADYLSSDFNSYKNGAAFIQFDRRLTRYATLNLGYAYSVANPRTLGGTSRTYQRINAGVSYGRALSFSRRTSVSFSSGSAITTSQDLSLPDTPNRTRFHAIGTATLDYEIGRTFTANVAYHRRVLFREEFDTPFFTDGVTAGVSGSVNRRLHVSAIARWSLSETEIQGDSQHRARSASAQATYAINRFLAGYARYVYYYYRFGEDIPLDPGIPQRLDRQGVRVGLTTSIPLIR